MPRSHSVHCSLEKKNVMVQRLPSLTDVGHCCRSSGGGDVKLVYMGQVFDSVSVTDILEMCVKSMKEFAGHSQTSVEHPFSCLLSNIQSTPDQVPFHQTRVDGLGPEGGGAAGRHTLPQVQLWLPSQQCSHSRDPEELHGRKQPHYLKQFPVFCP